MYLLLRGHIRDSFDNNDLLTLVRDFIHMDPSLEIFIHTWATENNNMPHRPHRPITEDIIRSYFQDVASRIQVILIDDENNIPLVGRTEGKVTETSPCNRLGWKRYLYSLYRVTNAAYKKNKDAYAINMRFDIFTNSCSWQTPRCRLVSFVHENLNTTFDRVKFWNNKETYGIDNIFIGSTACQAQLACHMHFCLDDISNYRKDVYHQEYILFFENILIYYFPEFLKLYPDAL